MEIATTGNAEYRDIEPGKVDTHFSLDLHTVDALDLTRMAEDLQARKNEIRSQIFREIANEVIPSMMEGREMEIPEQWSIDSTGSGTSTMENPLLSDGLLNTDHHLELDFSFRADREIDPATMIYLARTQIAGHIADSTVFDLERRFLGKTLSDVTSETSTRDGQAREDRVTEHDTWPEPGGSDTIPETDWGAPPRMEPVANDDEFLLDVPEIRTVAGEEEMSANDHYYDAEDSANALLEAETHEDFLRAIIRNDEDRIRWWQDHLAYLQARREKKDANGEKEEFDAIWGNAIRKAESFIEEQKDWLRESRKRLAQYMEQNVRNAA